MPNKYCLLIIEKTKFTYSLLVKAFKEQKKKKKKNKDQGQKQIKAIQNQRQVKTIKKYTYNDKAHWFQNKNKYLINLQMKGLKK